MEKTEMQKSAQYPEHYPGYPTTRLHLAFDTTADLQGIELPDGPWNHKNTPLPTAEEAVGFIAAGYSTDAIGRPLHPWAKELLSDERGVITGKGAYWNWGPNFTADPIVITTEARPRILLIERSDTGLLALPGGFVDANEEPGTAALREAHEETGIELTTQGQLVYQGPVADLRTTLNAWAETSAYLFTVGEPAIVKGNDDARSADWYFIDELPETLFGSHARLVQLALERHALPKQRAIETLLAVPESDRTTYPIDAGHMAYHHYVTSDGSDSAFVKRHDASQFTDPFREMHSRAYLKKEHAHYKHLASQGFTAIPERVALIDDSLLAMDHLSEADGWVWKAPDDQLDEYITSTLAALNALQTTTPLESPAHHQEVAPTYETFWREGWDAIDDESEQKIIDKIISLSRHWSDEQKQAVKELIENLPTLRKVAAGLDRNPPLFPAHNDARQSNIAWHPQLGTKLVDWSWADNAPSGADVTMFLIDLKKSGKSIDSYESMVNKEFALTLLGFWLGHSIWETKDGSSKVREHQIASASTAFQVIQRMSENKN